MTNICKNNSAKEGFTLLELLAVMLIMFMLMGMGTVAMKGLIRGSGVSGATSSVRSVLTQARQYAITKEQSVYVVFDKSAGSDGEEKSRMTICARYGTCDIHGHINGGGYFVRTEEPMPWGTNTLNGGTVYNLDNNGKSAVIENEPGAGYMFSPHPATDKIYTGKTNMGWHSGDGVGFEIAERRYLPSGMEFDDATISKNNNPVIFNANGSAGGNYSIKIQEMYIANPEIVDLKVDKLTGWVR
jgi:type II secretory pathway pseudopilin PulG